MDIVDCRLKLSPPLYAAYVARDAALFSARYDHDPWAEATWEKRAAELMEAHYPRADREALGAALFAYNRKVENGEAALANIAALSRGEALAVVGGQQAGLFTGPLFVIYKALTVIQLARKLAERLGRPVVPVFWIAGEDHDFDEVNHVYSLTPELDIQKIAIPHPHPDRRTAVSRLEIPQDALRAALDVFLETLPDSEFKPAIAERLSSIVAASRTLVDVFARVFAWLLGSEGLVLIDSDDPNVRRLERPLFRRLIEEAEGLRRALLDGEAAVRALGYAPQLEIAPESANIFLHEGGERVLLYGEDGAFFDRRARLRFDREALTALVAAHPERFSANVATRPLMQEYLFPVLAAVLGPSEVAYWAELREAFHFMTMRVPPLVPRFQATVVEPALEKALAAFGCEAARAVGDAGYIEACQAAWFRSQSDVQSLEARFEAVKADIRALYEPLIAEVGAMEKGLGPLGEENLRKILGHVDFLQSRALAAKRTQFDSALRRFARIRQMFAPLGKTQERVLNVFHFVNRHGVAWIRPFLEAPLPLDGRHRLVYWR
ncbi:MAG: bacillithiol biosynthesis cysteine-adding enzyme BshC [Hydrogenibacillus sp.]|nr:bacillithiol biosynthesis cysteine-adding enzyme BshC [Hydrogenibacillus sp.]